MFDCTAGMVVFRAFVLYVWNTITGLRGMSHFEDVVYIKMAYSLLRTASQLSGSRLRKRGQNASYSGREEADECRRAIIYNTCKYGVHKHP